MVGRVSIDNLDQTDPEGLLPQLLIFITGLITFQFWDFTNVSRGFPMPSTCGLRLKLPIGIPSFEEFSGLIVCALKEGSHDFGKL